MVEVVDGEVDGLSGGVVVVVEGELLIIGYCSCCNIEVDWCENGYSIAVANVFGVLVLV